MQEQSFASPWGVQWSWFCRAAMACRRPSDQMENLKGLLGLAGMELISPSILSAGLCIEKGLVTLSINS